MNRIPHRTSDSSPHPFPLRALAAGGLCVAALGMSGCQSITADSAESAQVRFVDMSVDAPALDLYLNGNGAAYNLSFGTVTSYVAVSPGEYHINANRGSTAQALVNTRAALGGTRQYTAVVSSALGSLQETVYPDANAPAPAGMEAVRVLHAAADAGPIDVYLVPSTGSGTASTSLVRDLSYTGGGSYIDVPAAASYAVAVVPAGVTLAAANGGLLNGVSVNGASGAVRTIVLSETPQRSGKGLYGLVLNDFDTP